MKKLFVAHDSKADCWIGIDYDSDQTDQFKYLTSFSSMAEATERFRTEKKYACLLIMRKPIGQIAFMLKAYIQVLNEDDKPSAVKQLSKLYEDLDKHRVRVNQK